MVRDGASRLLTMRDKKCCPPDTTGNSPESCQARLPKIFRFTGILIYGKKQPARAAMRDASRSSRNVVRDAMDAVVPQDVRRGCVRSSRVVLIPRRWDQANRVAMSALRARHAEICSRRRLASPVPRGEHGAADKPSCRECRSEFGLPSVTTLVCFFHFANEAAGAAGTRHSLRPLFCEGRGFHITRTQIAPRECRGVSPVGL